MNNNYLKCIKMVYEEFFFNNFCGYYRYFFVDVFSEFFYMSVIKVGIVL